MNHAQWPSLDGPEDESRGGEVRINRAGQEADRGEGSWHTLAGVHFRRADLGDTEKEEFTGILVGLQEKFKLEGVGPACVLGVIIERTMKACQI